jgi:hypothetical protein
VPMSLDPSRPSVPPAFWFPFPYIVTAMPAADLIALSSCASSASTGAALDTPRLVEFADKVHATVGQAIQRGSFSPQAVCVPIACIRIVTATAKVLSQAAIAAGGGAQHMTTPTHAPAPPATPGGSGYDLPVRSPVSSSDDMPARAVNRMVRDRAHNEHVSATLVHDLFLVLDAVTVLPHAVTWPAHVLAGGVMLWLAHHSPVWRVSASLLEGIVRVVVCGQTPIASVADCNVTWSGGGGGAPGSVGGDGLDDASRYGPAGADGSDGDAGSLPSSRSPRADAPATSFGAAGLSDRFPRSPSRVTPAPLQHAGVRVTVEWGDVERKRRRGPAPLASQAQEQEEDGPTVWDAVQHCLRWVTRVATPSYALERQSAASVARRRGAPAAAVSSTALYRQTVSRSEWAPLAFAMRAVDRQLGPYPYHLPPPHLLSSAALPLVTVAVLPTPQAAQAAAVAATSLTSRAVQAGAGRRMLTMMSTDTGGAAQERIQGFLGASTPVAGRRPTAPPAPATAVRHPLYPIGPSLLLPTALPPLADAAGASVPAQAASAGALRTPTGTGSGGGTVLMSSGSGSGGISRHLAPSAAGGVTLPPLAPVWAGGVGSLSGTPGTAAGSHDPSLPALVPGPTHPHPHLTMRHSAGAGTGRDGGPLPQPSWRLPVVSVAGKGGAPNPAPLGLVVPALTWAADTQPPPPPPGPTDQAGGGGTGAVVADSSHPGGALFGQRRP